MRARRTGRLNDVPRAMSMQELVVDFGECAARVVGVGPFFVYRIGKHE
jgi:hypothetical protein